jgi:hypothetical protein
MNVYHINTKHALILNVHTKYVLTMLLSSCKILKIFSRHGATPVIPANWNAEIGELHFKFNMGKN